MLLEITVPTDDIGRRYVEAIELNSQGHYIDTAGQAQRITPGSTVRLWLTNYWEVVNVD